jgi:L-lysine 2,3-aminomutase
VFLQALREHAPNIRVVRVATRIPAQAPELVNGDVLRLFEN